MTTVHVTRRAVEIANSTPNLWIVDAQTIAEREACEALETIERGRPALDADTTDADLAEWARTCIIPILEEIGYI